METVSKLVIRFDSLIETCTAPSSESTRNLEFTYASFVAAVQELDSPIGEIAAALELLPNESQQNRIDLWLMAACQCSDESFVSALCKLLAVRNRYTQHEWVAELLGEIGDPRAIQALVCACEESWDYDALGSLQHRCIDALLGISTPESIDSVKNLAKSNLESVREYARMALSDDGGKS